MGFTTFANQKLLNAFWQAASLGAPATHNIGLLTAATWQATHAYSLGAYVIPTTFGSISDLLPGKIFKCTTAGTSGGSQPTWPTTAGGTVTDGGAVWTEVTNLFQAGTFTAAEISGNNYSRVAVTANSTNFANATSAQPSLTNNATVINMPTPSADWGLAVAWIDSDASSAGNIWNWGAMASALDCASGSSPSFAVNGLTSQLTP